MNMITPKEFAKLFNLTRFTVYKLIKNGELPAIKLGLQWRIDLDKVSLHISSDWGMDKKA